VSGLAGGRLIAVVDTETTGIPDFRKPADDPSQPRVAAIACVLVDLQSRANVGSFFHLIRPDGWEMPAEAGAINGLTNDMLRRYGVPVARALATYNAAIDLGVMVVCHNVDFDMKMLRGEFRRAGLPDRYDETPTFCTYRAAPEELRDRGGRKLQNVYRYWTGREPPKAHAAMVDVLMVREILFAMVDRGVAIEPRFPGQKAGGAASPPRQQPVTPAPAAPAPPSGEPVVF
jgi:DNA polymerase-3 subunit epsilon